MRFRNWSMVLLAVLLLWTAVVPQVQAENEPAPVERQPYVIGFIDKEMGVASLGSNVKKSYHQFPIVLAELTLEEVVKLQADPNLSFIEEDGEVTKSSIAASQKITKKQTEKTRLVTTPQVTAATSTATGKGIKVAVLDSGSWSGDSLTIKGGTNIVNEGEGFSDDNGHGTYVASLVKKLAPDSDVYAVKVLDDQGKGKLSQVLGGLDWAIANQMQVVTMSFGTRIYSQALAAATSTASDKGLLMLAAAGNASLDSLDFPAQYNSVMAVGAVDADQKRLPSSNKDSKLELSAVATGLEGLDAQGKPLTLEGTSAAVPQAAAVAALYWSTFPTLKASEIREMMNVNAVNLGSMEEYGHGLVQYKLNDVNTNTDLNPNSTEDQPEQEVEKAEEGTEAPKIVPTEKSDLTGAQSEDLTALGDSRLEIERQRMESARELQKQKDDYAAAEGRLTAGDLVSEFGVTQEWVDNKLSEGSTLSELFTSLWQANGDGFGNKSSQSETENIEVISPETVNNSNDQQSTVDASGAEALKPAREATATDAVYGNTSNIPAHSVNNKLMNKFAIKPTLYSKVTNQLNGAGATKATASLMSDPNTLPTPEKIVKPYAKTSEAPYTVGLHQENVSLLSGSLSISENDLTLPGRNGLSFTLGRTYNSSSAQWDEMDVSYSYDYNYVYDYNVSTRSRNLVYDISGSFSEMLVKYPCSGTNNTPTGSSVYSAGTGSVTPIDSQTFVTKSSADAYKATIPTKPRVVEHPCGYEPNRVYYKEYSFSSWSTLERYGSWSNAVQAPNPFTSQPFTTSDQANADRAILNAGAYNAIVKGGTYDDGYYDQEYTFTVNANQIVYAVIANQNAVNTTTKDMMESKFPIGKGWSWDIPYLKFDNGRTYVSLGDGGTYAIEGNQLKNYPWSDLTFTSDSSVISGGRTSSYALKSVYGIDQYFDIRGNILLIRDNHNNTISFQYSAVAPYGDVLTGVTDAIGNTMNIAYSSASVEISIGSRKVIYSKSVVNGKEMLSQVIDPQGRQTTYSYAVKPAKFSLVGSTPTYDNAYALLTEVVHPTGVKTKYEYEINPVTRMLGDNQSAQAYRVANRQDVETLSDGSIRTYNYSSIVYQGDMGSNYRGDTTFSATLFDGLLEHTHTYLKHYSGDEVGNDYYETESKVSDGTIVRKTTNTYDQAKRRTVPISVTNVTQNIVTGATSTPVTSSQTFDDYQNTLTSVSPLGVTATNVFDPNTHLLKTSIVPVQAGQSIYTEITSRNAQGDILEAIVKDTTASGAVLQHSQFQYDSYGNVTLIRNKEENRDLDTLITYDESKYQGAYPTSINQPYTDADGIAQIFTNSMEYDKTSGLITSYRTGKGDTTSYTYDKLGRIIQVLQPDQTTVSYSIDDAHNEIRVTDEEGRMQYMQWNALGMSTEQGIVSGASKLRKATQHYDSYSRPDWTEDALGRRTTSEYDKWGRAIAVTAPGAGLSTVQYDDIARSITSMDADGTRSRTWGDILGRVVKQEVGQGSGYLVVGTQTYTYTGEVLTAQDAKNALTQYSYDPLGRVIQVTGADGNIYKYSYDRAGNMTKITYPDLQVLTRSYDQLGRLISSTDAIQQQTRQYYDANGNVSRTVDKSGKSFTFTYNNRDQLLSKQGPTDTISYTYDKTGARKSLTDSGNLVTQYNYDPVTSLLTSVIYPDGKTIAYQYNTDGSRSEMHTPFNDTVNYGYNSFGQLDQVKWNGAMQGQYAYTPAGRVQSISKANNIVENLTFTDGSLTSLTHKTVGSANPLRSYQYGYDNNRNITSISESAAGIQTKNNQFAYDSMNRISTSTLNNESYSYDSRGNRKALNSTSSIYETSDDVNYEYDEWDRLKRVTRSGGNVVEYTYNGDNLLATRKENNVTTRYYYDGDRVIGEGIVQADGSVTEKASYLYGEGLIMREDSTNARGYYLHNGHGDVVEIRSDAGSILNSYDYDLWGNTIASNETVDNLFRYSGEMWDEGAKLQYLRARWYDPSMGRFINKDTYEGDITNPLSLNLYTYVNNNPLIYFDPTGHWNEKLGFNYVINEMKNMWAIAPTQAEKDYWAQQAENERKKVRQTKYYKNGYYSESDIMQTSDPMIPMDEIMKQAHAMYPTLSAIQGFTEATAQYLENHPGEGIAIGAGGLFVKGSRIAKLEEGLNFAVKPAEHMANSARFVPVQTLISAIKYGKGLPDPRGSSATMFYTVMYRNGAKYNLEVLYDATNNMVLHFEYTRKAIGDLPAISK